MILKLERYQHMKTEVAIGQTIQKLEPALKQFENSSGGQRSRSNVTTELHAGRVDPQVGSKNLQILTGRVGSTQF